MKPLLAHTYEPHRVHFPCYVQPKLNGIRALYQNGRFQSRDGIPFSAGLLDHIAKPLLGLFSHETILDGELYVHGWPLQRINGAVTPVRQTPIEDTLKVEYHVFDSVDFQTSFEQRQKRVESTLRMAHNGYKTDITKIPPVTNIRFVTTAIAKNEAEANDFYAHCVSQGYEGMMYRLGDCPYTRPKDLAQGRLPAPRTKFLSDKDNRCWHLIKRKDWQDDEFSFVSLNTTIGEKGERGFQLWCRTKSNKEFKVSSGLTNAELDHYLANPPTDKLIKVKYLVLSNEGIPLNATIIAIL
jgi:ATP-dependent DNA ligase